MVEAFTVGVIVSFYDVSVVLQAFFLTASVVVGLTLFTFQTRKDFSGWGAGLMSGLWILIIGGFMQIFIGGEMTRMGMAIGGAFLFSCKISHSTVLTLLKTFLLQALSSTIHK